MRHPTKAAVEKFTELLGLRVEPHLQDWEIECADPSRVEEFIAAYHDHASDDDERFTLMALILGSYEEYHSLSPPDPGAWEKIKTILVADRKIHDDHISYYQCLDVPGQQGMFPITNLMRELD